MAALLSIPTSKTLLRRHLSLHYRELIGREIMQAKRELCEADPDGQQLTPTAKVGIKYIEFRGGNLIPKKIFHNPKQ